MLLLTCDEEQHAGDWGPCTKCSRWRMATPFCFCFFSFLSVRVYISSVSHDRHTPIYTFNLAIDRLSFILCVHVYVCVSACMCVCFHPSFLSPTFSPSVKISCLYLWRMIVACQKGGRSPQVRHWSKQRGTLEGVWTRSDSDMEAEWFCFVVSCSENRTPNQITRELNPLNYHH